MFGLKALGPLDLRGHPLTLEWRERRLGPALRIEAGLIRRPIEPLLLTLDARLQRCKAAIRVLPVDIAERNDVFGCEVDQIAAALSANAHAGDVERIAGSREPSAEHVPGDDRQPRAGDRHVREKTAACLFRHVRSYRSSRILMLRKASEPAWSP